MLRTDLLDLVNHGDVWAFIGSGASVDSGCPTWTGLVTEVLKKVGGDERKTIQGQGQFDKSVKSGNFPRLFSIIEKVVGREQLDTIVKAQISTAGPASELPQLIADWPFAGYITTNYDTILQQALDQIGRKGWTSVGNTADEIKKVSGDARRLVWHVHGSCQLPNNKSKLVLTEEDYDDLYLRSSLVIDQLRSLLAHRRVVFIGFGFKDVEVTRLLRQVGTFCSPARPAYAFLSDIAGGEHSDDRKELLERYNVDVIPYRVRRGSHRECWTCCPFTLPWCCAALCGLVNPFEMFLPTIQRLPGFFFTMS